MTIKSDRLKDAIKTLAYEEIVAFAQSIEHTHGIISLLDVVISSDKSYADLMVFGQGENKELPKFLSPISGRIYLKISKELALRKTPRIRFKVAKNAENKKDILTLIRELDEQYGLSKN